MTAPTRIVVLNFSGDPEPPVNYMWPSPVGGAPPICPWCGLRPCKRTRARRVVDAMRRIPLRDAL